MESVRKQVEERSVVREKASTSVDLPMSQESKRVLALAGEEAERLEPHRPIGTEHLLLGLLREEKCLAAEILRGYGLQLSATREELNRVQSEKAPSQAPKETPLLSEFSRDLSQAARENRLDPLIGRENELERVVHILGRRTKNNPVLIGEPGVGKAALVKGLACRIASGDVPSLLGDRRILALDLSPIMATARLSGEFEARLKALVRELTQAQDAIVFIEELFALRGIEGLLDAADFLKPVLLRGDVQCIGAAIPADYRQAIETEPWLERCFQGVKVPPPNEADAIKILVGIKDRYEKFHDVRYTDEALEYAVRHSNRYLPSRHLPDKAIDLIDEAGAAVKLRQSTLPPELLDVQRRIKFLIDRMQASIANHEFEKARSYSNEERKERENLRLLREQHNLGETSPATVTRQDIEEAFAQWTDISIKDEGTDSEGT
jgi:ATP-dependent Clp protease ATP-binding subunit ClpC